MSPRRRSIESTRPPVREVEAVDMARMWRTWRMAEVESGVALMAWYQASKGAKARAYDVYMDALDWEARAADALAQLLEPLRHPGACEALAA
jgi:hypothetical protein